MNFVQNVQNQVPAETFQQFLAILNNYLKDPKSVEDVHVEVQALFAEHPDLVQGFEKFLPESAGNAKDLGETRRVGEGMGS